MRGPSRRSSSSKTTPEACCCFAMAFYRPSFTGERLEQLFSSRAAQQDDAGIRASFGAPLRHTTQQRQHINVPYTFLASAPLVYNQLGRTPHYIDQFGRHVFAYGASNPELIYVRVPKGNTARENRAEMPTTERVDLPHYGDELLLSSRTAVIRVYVERVVSAKLATALVQVSEPVPTPAGLDVQEEDEEEDARVQRAEQRAERKAEHFRENGYSIEAAQETRLARRSVRSIRPIVHRQKIVKAARVSRPKVRRL